MGCGLRLRRGLFKTDKKENGKKEDGAKLLTCCIFPGFGFGFLTVLKQ